MCALPISASNAPVDAINLLWRVSRIDAPAELTRLLADVTSTMDDPLQAAIIAAVTRHLRSRALLSLAMLDVAQAEASEVLSDWDNVALVISAVDPQMAVRAHAFHARLASRHRGAYRDFARRQLLELVRAARLKSETILAEIALVRGDMRRAAGALQRISAIWRADLPVRLPGLRAVELAAAHHYAAIGDAARAQEMRDRAATITGLMSAYPEDAPESWPPQPSQEGLLRFAFAAARLPASLDISQEIAQA
jgi:hypothetical protein